MTLTASQHRKAVREGVIADSDQRSAISRRAQHSVLSPQHSALSPEAVAARLAICAPCEHRRTEGSDGATGGKWVCIRCETPDFRCWRTADLRHKAAVAEAVCYEGNWESVKSEA